MKRRKRVLPARCRAEGRRKKRGKLDDDDDDVDDLIVHATRVGGKGDQIKIPFVPLNETHCCVIAPFNYRPR